MNQPKEPVISLSRVDLVFGPKPQSAFARIDAGDSTKEAKSSSGQVVAVNGVDFAVHEGEILVLMGHSGSGKSSLLRCINGLNGRGIGSLRGDVLVRANGSCYNVGRCSKAELRELRAHGIAMVFQGMTLLPFLSVCDNTALGLEFQGVCRSERRERALEQLKMVQLDGWEHRMPRELSGGMQQRVGLARAFATKSPILLMDEPFSALDPLIRFDLQDELVALQTKLKKTIVFVSHDLEEALRIGSRIAIMESGRIIQTGTPLEIVTAPATKTVRDLVAHVNPLGVLEAQHIMVPSSTMAEGMTVVGPRTRMRELVPFLLKNGTSLAVKDDFGKVVGIVSSHEILKALVPSEGSRQGGNS